HERVGHRGRRAPVVRVAERVDLVAGVAPHDRVLDHGVAVVGHRHAALMAEEVGADGADDGAAAEARDGRIVRERGAARGPRVVVADDAALAVDLRTATSRIHATREGARADAVAGDHAVAHEELRAAVGEHAAAVVVVAVGARERLAGAVAQGQAFDPRARARDRTRGHDRVCESGGVDDRAGGPCDPEHDELLALQVDALGVGAGLDQDAVSVGRGVDRGLDAPAWRDGPVGGERGGRVPRE
ncbi:MAG: hypothetical protein ACK559_01455, partial [bacterium]